METLSIKNFAGLEDASIEVRPVTGLIGPQASGKSVIAKLLYFFREIAWRLPAALEEGAAEYRAECRGRFERYFEFEKPPLSDFEIRYTTNGESILVAVEAEESANDELPRLEWSEFYESALKRFGLKRRTLVEALQEDKASLEETRQTLRQEYYDEASKVLGAWSVCQQIFVPAGRAFFSQFQASVFSRLESGDVLDPFMVAFGSHLEQSRMRFHLAGFFDAAEEALRPDAGSLEEVRSAFQRILRAEFIDGRFLKFANERWVTIERASSGHQEVLPLLQLLAQFSFYPSQQGRAVYIEEPEAHLYPATQKQIVEFMASVFRRRHGKMHLVITTHSPYILTSINNLLQAGRLYGNADASTRTRLEEIIPEACTFKPDEVAFYALEGGHTKSIIDPETGLIDASAIDQVSEDIATQFDELLAEANEKS